MTMRLADFILRDMETIIAHWVAFAGTQHPAARDMPLLALRDHGEEILHAIAQDLRTPQSREEQELKSKGLSPATAGSGETAAQTHAILRARSGFSVTQLAAEYRALRASVLRLWVDDCAPEQPHLDDIIRFNEAIDQALAESIEYFTQQVELARNLFLGMLGHDLRTPLQSIQMTATYLTMLNAGDRIAAAARRLISSGARMQALLNDLVDFNRTQLGVGIPIQPAPLDLAQVVADEVADVLAAYPDRRIESRVVSDTQGVWDGRRLRQLVSNLVVNALKYGKPGTPVEVLIGGNAEEVSIAVKNTGDPIDPATLASLFEPLTRGVQASGGDSSLGLGLYIAREIARAHRGEIAASSAGGETTFTVRLPRV